MWNDSDYYFPEREARYRPVWPPHLRHRQPFGGPYARPREMPPFMKPDLGAMMGMYPPFPRIPELTTPHAAPIVQRSLTPARPAHTPLYQDFSAPARPIPININVQTSAQKCIIEWKHPTVPKTMKYTYMLDVWEGLQCDKFEFAPHITSHKLKTSPGTWFKIELTCIDKAGTVIALGRARFKAVFSHDEMQLLYIKALDFVGTAMHAFHVLYRCKPKLYYDDIHFRCGGVMEKYLKDNNGQAASSINGAISGLFFSARLSPDGSLPTHSPFGNVRMRIPAFHLLDPAHINMYFSDFYCNYITHYVTVVICEKRSDTDMFCMQRLIKLAPDSKPFLSIVKRPPLFEPAFRVNKNVWVEIYYTENIPLTWGQFDNIIATGAGTSRVGGLPHNKQCQMCNLYPQKANSASAKSQLGSKLNSTFQLLLNLGKEELGSDAVEDYADIIETICALVDAVVEQTENEKSSNVEDSGEQATEVKQLEAASEVVSKLPDKLTCDAMTEAVAMLKKATQDLDKYFEAVEVALSEAKRCYAPNELAVM